MRHDNLPERRRTQKPHTTRGQQVVRLKTNAINTVILYFCLVTDVPLLLLLLKQQWSSPLRVQDSDCSTFRIMCDVPSIAVFIREFIERFPSMVPKCFSITFVTIPCGCSFYRRNHTFHVSRSCSSSPLLIFLFCFLLCDIVLCYWYLCQFAHFLIFVSIIKSGLIPRSSVSVRTPWLCNTITSSLSCIGFCMCAQVGSFFFLINGILLLLLLLLLLL
jgi:hypothetical protein